jgi:hypothetical protein
MDRVSEPEAPLELRLTEHGLQRPSSICIPGVLYLISRVGHSWFEWGNNLHTNVTIRIDRQLSI